MEKPEIRMRWNNAEEKLAWMRALAQLLDHLQPHPARQIDREWFTLVNDGSVRSSTPRDHAADGL
jgi:hypothetical protein